MTSAVSANLWGRWRPPISWFPGHMAKATKGVKERLKACDLVIELRDARVPFSSINTTFDVLMENKPRLLVYNKIDLADHRATQLLREQCKRDGTTAMFLSATSKGSGIQQALEWLRQESKGRFITTGTLAMVAGVPNVGKSTFINAIASAARPNGSKRRNSGDRAEGGGATWVSGGGGSAKHLAKVGARPGVTRTLSSVLVCEAPLVRLLDTPGILVPKIENVEIGLRLALTGAVRDEVVGEDMLVAYLVDCLGRVKGGSLLEALPHNLLAAHGGFDDDDGSRGGGGSPISSLEDVVALVERASGAAGKGSEEERTRIACRFILAQFRAGKLGRFTLDDPSNPAPLVAAATETDETSSRPASSSIHADQFKNTGPARNGKSAPAPASSLLYRPSDIF